MKTASYIVSPTAKMSPRDTRQGSGNEFFHHSIIPNLFDKYSEVKSGNISLLPTLT